MGTLWRRFTKQQANSQIVNRSTIANQIDNDRFLGEYGCNSCVLYWKVNGTHRPAELCQMEASRAPLKRNRKTEIPDVRHKKYKPLQWPNALVNTQDTCSNDNQPIMVPINSGIFADIIGKNPNARVYVVVNEMSAKPITG